MATPYNLAPGHSFWSRGVARRYNAADLVPKDAVIIRRGDRVMSAGSCFAANIVPYLERSGFSYVRAEPKHPLLRVPAENLGYDNFSAAYGNIYTARQLLQLFYRSFGLWRPKEEVWEDEGEFVDPFRPGLRYRARSRVEFDALTRQHLLSVRRAFEEATVFVFTLGLTEAWVSRADGAVFPACPGTVAGVFDPTRHTFHNMSVSDVVADLNEFIREVRKINPVLRIVLTVSPVPLVATATGGHVLPATIYSKSVLRVAAEEVVRSNLDIQYFPAYEIVTGPQAPESFYEADRRNVSRTAVDTVMGALLSRCETSERQIERSAAAPSISDSVVGDEERVGSDPGSPATPDAQSLSQLITQAECEEAMSDVAARD